MARICGISRAPRKGAGDAEAVEVIIDDGLREMPYFFP